MSKRVRSDGEPLRGPIFPRWGDPDDDFAQNDRWAALAHDEIVLEVPGGPIRHKPLCPEGTRQYGALQLRCGAKNCGAMVGGVYVSAGAHWQGEPFTYAEVLRVTEPEARPAAGKRLRLVLDSVTRAGMVRSDCPRHGTVCAPVVEVLAAVPAGLAKLQSAGKGAPYMLFPC